MMAAARSKRKTGDTTATRVLNWQKRISGSKEKRDSQKNEEDEEKGGKKNGPQGKGRGRSPNGLAREEPCLAHRADTASKGEKASIREGRKKEN